ncbi:hypothetical protein D9M72_414420 [compost metagenome]
MKLWLSRLKRFRRIDHDGKLLVVDDDGLCRVTRLGHAIGNHDRHGVTDIAHSLMRERPPGAHLHRRSILGVDHPAADQVADAIGENLLAVEHVDDSRHALGRRRIHLQNLRVRMRAAHEHRIFHARHGHVVRIAALSGQEPLVFLARHPRANAFNAHCLSPPEISSDSPSMTCLRGEVPPPNLPLFCGHAGAAHLSGGSKDRLDDIVIAGTATDVAFELGAHRRLVQLALVPSDHVDGRHHHAGCAEAALQAVIGLEGCLNGMQLAVCGQSFDGGDLRARRLRGEGGTALHRPSVHMDDTGAALRRVAADMGAGQSEIFAYELHQQCAVVAMTAHLTAVDRHCYFRHFAPPGSVNANTSAAEKSGEMVHATRVRAN